MHEQDEICSACGCPESCRPGGEYCDEHQRQVEAFQRWLEAPNEGCSSAAPAFDLERNFLMVRHRPA